MDETNTNLSTIELHITLKETNPFPKALIVVPDFEFANLF